MKKFSTLASVAVLVTMFATNTTAATIGSIPGVGGSFNDGLEPVYGAGTTERFGWYGGNLALFGADDITGATILFEYLGKEAGNTNTFTFQGVQLFTTQSNGGWLNSLQTATVAGVGNGLLDFSFGTLDRNGNFLSVANGSNPDEMNGEPGINFFATLVANEFGRSGVSWDLWFDDQVQGDDNHDDMAIRMTVFGGTINEVPAPAGLLLLGGLGAFAAFSRRYNKRA